MKLGVQTTRSKCRDPLSYSDTLPTGITFATPMTSISVRKTDIVYWNIVFNFIIFQHSSEGAARAAQCVFYRHCCRPLDLRFGSGRARALRTATGP